MLIHALRYVAFRNITRESFAPAPGFNVFWGQNAQGKTNLLEGIYLLGVLKSFRAQRNDELIGLDHATARLEAAVTTAGVERHLDLRLSPQGKQIRLDGKGVRRAGEVLGTLRPILFSPEEVSLVKGSPGGRRDLIDRALLQVDPGYLERFQKFLQILRQRNRLLKDGAAERQLAPWSENYIVAAAAVRADRFRYTEELRPALQQAYRFIAQGGEEADLVYPAPPDLDFTSELRGAIDRCRVGERRLGQTQVGPHRDDPRFLVNGRPLRLFGSQGQQRCFILAFKAAQIEHLEQQTGEPPVLLLDDITSELDSQRKSYLFDFLRERRGQVFITTTDPDSLRHEGLNEARFYHVKRGKLHDD